MNLQERFLKYVSYYTMSQDDVDQIPSTDRQFELGRFLEQEMKEIGLSKVSLDENCYVYGLLPATPGMEKTKSIGFISHMDTAPAFNGKDVKPQIIPNYDGKDVLLKGSNEHLKVSDFPTLINLKGKTLITTDGTSLLGADDKAGIAEILTAIEEIIASKTPHGDIWVGFTPDEEVGRGSDKFNLDYFKADYAYTVDGDYEGEIAYENFNAASATFKIHGINVHPGSAKNIMKNPASIACELHCMLPVEQAPEYTEKREGFYMLSELHGDNTSATLSYIIRDHDATKFFQKQAYCKKIAELLNFKYGEGTVDVVLKESYRNMLEVIEENFYIIENAQRAIKAVGLELISTPVRGGTDGARLSFMGLPCPNLGTGGYGFHGPFEHITVEGMRNAVSIIKELITNPVKK